MQTDIGILILQQRHRTDSQVNNRESKVLRKGHLVDEKWHRVQVIISIVQIKIRISLFGNCLKMSTILCTGIDCLGWRRHQDNK